MTKAKEEWIGNKCKYMDGTNSSRLALDTHHVKQSRSMQTEDTDGKHLTESIGMLKSLQITSWTQVYYKKNSEVGGQVHIDICYHQRWWDRDLQRRKSPGTNGIPT